MRKKLALPLVLMLTLTVAGCSTDPTTSEEYVSLEQDLAAATQLVAATEADLAQMTADRDALTAAAVNAEIPADVAALLEDWWEANERGDGSIVDLYQAAGYHLYGAQKIQRDDLADHFKSPGWDHEWITEPFLITDDGDGRYVVTRGLQNSLGAQSFASALTFEIRTAPDGQLQVVHTTWMYVTP